MRGIVETAVGRLLRVLQLRQRQVSAHSRGAGLLLGRPGTE